MHHITTGSISTIRGTIFAKASAATTTKTTSAPASSLNAYLYRKKVTYMCDRVEIHGGCDGAQGQNECSEHKEELREHTKAMPIK